MLTLFRMCVCVCVGGGAGGEGWQKGSPTSFSPLTSTTVGLSPQNFLTFPFNPFVTLV